MFHPQSQNAGLAATGLVFGLMLAGGIAGGVWKRRSAGRTGRQSRWTRRRPLTSLSRMGSDVDDVIANLQNNVSRTLNNNNSNRTASMKLN